VCWNKRQERRPLKKLPNKNAVQKTEEKNYGAKQKKMKRNQIALELKCIKRG